MTKNNDRVTLDRTCGNCICYKEGWCQYHKHATKAINYGCKTHTTADEFDAKMKEMDKRLNSENATRVNYMLTLMYTFLNAGMTLMTRSEMVLGQLVGGKDWRFERKKAASEITKSAERIESLHAQFFQSDMNKVFTDHGKKDFDSEAYDNHEKDAYEVCRLLMLYIDRCWGDENAANKVIACLEGMPTGNIFTDKDIERYRMR